MCVCDSERERECIKINVYLSNLCCVYVYTNGGPFHESSEFSLQAICHRISLLQH